MVHIVGTNEATIIGGSQQRAIRGLLSASVPLSGWVGGGGGGGGGGGAGSGGDLGGQLEGGAGSGPLHMWLEMAFSSR